MDTLNIGDDMAENRIDSTHVASEMMQSALRQIPVPNCVELEAKEMPFWETITQARAEWTNVDLIHAANLARCMCSIEENQRLLRVEGDVIKNARDTPIMNPRFTILEQLSRRAAALSTKIHVHAGATMGEPKNSRKKNTAKREAIENLSDDEDDLIATSLH
jgi:hypothetical protein